MLLRLTIAELVILLLLAAGCKGEEVAPYYQPRSMHDASEPDASADDSPDAAADAGPMSSDPPVSGLPDDPATQVGDKISKALAPVHTSTSCADFSSGSAYAFRDDDKRGRLFTELAPNMTMGRECGYWQSAEGETIDNWRIRRSDGKALYLRNGFMFQFVPDEAPTGPQPELGWALKNDVKMSPTSPCGKGSAETGPFRGFVIQPNGKFIFECLSGSSETHSTYEDQNGKAAGTWDFPRARAHDLAADDSGRLIHFRDRITTNDKGGTVQVSYDHGIKPELKVVGAKGCMNIQGGASIVAFRALPTGFLLVIRNACGLQLWRTTASAIEYLASYWEVDELAVTLAENEGFADVAFGGVLYFDDEINLDATRSVSCNANARICAIAPFVKGPASPKVIPLRSWTTWWTLYGTNAG